MKNCRIQICCLLEFNTLVKALLAGDVKKLSILNHGE